MGCCGNSNSLTIEDKQNNRYYQNQQNNQNKKSIKHILENPNNLNNNNYVSSEEIKSF